MKNLIKITVFSVLLIFALQANGQSKLDIRIGTGISLLGTGDMRTFNVENELNYKLNNLFSSSASLQLGKSNYGVWETGSFVQGNLNIFISPFKNDKKNDFRVGTGISYCNVTDVYMESLEYTNNVWVDEDHKVETRNSFGYNIIVEDTYSITDRLLLGLKVFTNPYTNGDINSGVLLKFGVKF